DAAVFEPGVDFKWRNDTTNPVFIWSWSGDTSLTIDVWGIPTGRTVVISDAVQRNFVHPAADQPADPAYPPGAFVDGRDAFRTRTAPPRGHPRRPAPRDRPARAPASQGPLRRSRRPRTRPNSVASARFAPPTRRDHRGPCRDRVRDPREAGSVRDARSRLRAR